jgi:hypothetical protein
MLPEATPPPVQAQDVAQQIRLLKHMRREATWWRYGSLAVIALTVMYSILTLRNSALALVQPGPGQTEFTNKLTTDLQSDVLPNVQQIATQTLTEMRPEVISSFEKLNERTPELAEASLEQFNLLQKNLPARSETVLNETFTAEIKKRESKIREMFPDVTDEKIQTLVTNLTNTGKKRMPNVADQLVGKHIDAVDGIMNQITTIHSQENVNAESSAANWEMALAVMDLVRDDLRELAPPEAKTGSATASGKAPAPKKSEKVEAKK